MTDNEWMAYGGAVALIGDEGAVLRALKTGAIGSRGVIYNPLLGRDELEDIPADRWAQWTFLPTFKGSDYMRRFCWLVPPGKEQVRVCTGFGDIRLLRSDVERLAVPAAIAEQIEEKPVEPEQSPRAKARLPAKEPADEARARKLMEMFPDGRRPKREIIAARLGVDPRTVDRALRAAKAKPK
jgi:hypothetical protein